MNEVAPPAARAVALEELRGSLLKLLAANRRLRSRDSRQPGGIGFSNYRLLSELRREGSMTASALAVAAELSNASVTEMLDGLVAAGLVERARTDVDRRVVRARLTARGRRLFDAEQARFHASFELEVEDLDLETLGSASLVLERLAAFFDRH